MNVSPESIVRNILHTGTSWNVSYVCAAYGDMTVRQLLAAIQKIEPVYCNTEHELSNTSYLDCPFRPYNSLCNHQCEDSDIKHPITGEIAVPKERQIHVTGLLRAGLYVLHAAGKAPILPTGKPLTQFVLDMNAEGLESSDNPAFLEYDRFRKHSLLAVGSPPLEERMADRLPQFVETSSLVQLKTAINTEKRKWQDPTDAVKNAVQSALEQLLAL